MNSNELMHHGIHGMRWGVRRYQNKDGSLTAAGRKRINQLDSEYQRLTGMKLNKKTSSADVKKTESKPKSKSKSKSISEMTNEEIQEKINRITLEQNLKSLTPKKISAGKRFTETVMNDVITPAATDVGKQLARSMFADGVNKVFNLEGDNKVYANNKKK
jgi:hypothetical protein